MLKLILSEVASAVSVPAAAKTKCFVHLSFSSTLQLINCISSDVQTLTITK